MCLRTPLETKALPVIKTRSELAEWGLEALKGLAGNQLKRRTLGFRAIGTGLSFYLLAAAEGEGFQRDASEFFLSCALCLSLFATYDGTVDAEHREQILSWLRDKSGSVRLPPIALSQPAEVARFVADHFARKVNKQGSRLPVARMAQLLGQLQAPEAAWALGLIWLWPRRISEGHFRDVLSRANAESEPAPSPSDMMLRLFRQAGGDIELELRLGGSTVQADPRSVSALHGVLLERATVASVRFDEADWLRDIVPALQHPLVWSAYEDGTLTDISYGPLGDEFAERRPWSGSARDDLVERGGYHFWIVTHQRARRGGTQIGVCHPAEISNVRRENLRVAVKSEPFEQIHREVHAADHHPLGRRTETSFRKQDIEDFHVFSHLRNRGWRRGQAIDFGIFFEMSLSIPELGWRPYVRLFPGIPASGPEGKMQYVHALAFQRASVGEVPWGHDFTAHTAVVFDGVPHSLKLYLDLPHKLDWKLEAYSPEMLVGEELSKVPPLVYSEAMRTITQLMQAHGRECANPVENSSRFFDLKQTR